MSVRVTPRQQRKRIRRLYSRAEDYDLEYQNQKEDIRIWLKLCRRLQARNVLELGVGTCRIAIPLAKAGIEVTGIDIAEKMTALARQKLDDMNPRRRNKLQVHLISEDMSQFDLGTTQPFDMIFIGLNTFYHLLPQQRHSCIHSVKKHLKPGGVFAIDVFNTEERIRRGSFGVIGLPFTPVRNVCNKSKKEPIILERYDTDLYDADEGILHCDRRIVKRELHTGKYRTPYTKLFDLYILPPDEIRSLLSTYFQIDEALSKIGSTKVSHLWVCRNAHP